MHRVQFELNICDGTNMNLLTSSNKAIEFNDGIYERSSASTWENHILNQFWIICSRLSRPWV
jgi:predicted acetyltransferase